MIKKYKVYLIIQGEKEEERFLFHGNVPLKFLRGLPHFLRFLFKPINPCKVEKGSKE